MNSGCVLIESVTWHLCTTPIASALKASDFSCRLHFQSQQDGVGWHDEIQFTRLISITAGDKKNKIGDNYYVRLE